MARRRKPNKTPEQIEAERILARSRDLEAVSLQPEAAALPRQSDVEITRAGEKRARVESDKKADHDTARRLDAFEALRAGFAPGCYDAARRFERQVYVMLGLDERGPRQERVDGSPPKSDRSDAMCAAQEAVEDVLDRVPPRDGWLLQELIAPPFDRGTWRDHVAYITGETHAHAQGAVVRAATVNLRDAYTAIDRKVAA